MINDFVADFIFFTQSFEHFNLIFYECMHKCMYASRCNLNCCRRLPDATREVDILRVETLAMGCSSDSMKAQLKRCLQALRLRPAV